MEKVIAAMNDKIEILEKRIKKAEEYLEKTTEGWLRITRSAGKPRYYQITQSGETTGKYLKQNEINIAQELAQKDYYKKYIVKAQNDISRLSKALEMLKSASDKSVYKSLNADRRKLITPFDLSDEEYAKQWENEDFEKNDFMPEHLKYSTEKGELVRSKSELLIADMYYSLGIPYRYEAGVKLKGGLVRYPDFTVLRVRDRKEFYHEHFGLLDDSEYRKKCLIKLDEYRKNGIYTGKNLIITYEGLGSDFNIKEIKKATKDLLL
ncbi:MAG: hypothetical protein E7242_09175 [Lachnospiraceae bacterium]|nr:hypothetical protein [Lachnospiraceae bacterium]